MCISLGEWLLMVTICDSFVHFSTKKVQILINKQCLLQKLCAVPKRYIAQTTKHWCTKSPPLINRSGIEAYPVLNVSLYNNYSPKWRWLETII